MNTTNFDITFWGVRGSHPTPSPKMMKYGGNTPCIQVDIGGKTIIFDAGTGIVQLGNILLETKEALEADIFISHTHWDHIQGFPFFAPIYMAGNFFKIYGESKDQHSFSNVIESTMKAPYFPTAWDDIKANLEFKETKGNERINIDKNITINTIDLCHPGGSLGYRINYENKSCCYISDIEHKKSNHFLKSFINNTDVLIFDAQFTNREYFGDTFGSSKEGWGHSTWEDAVNLAKEAGIKKLVLFHHDVNRSDDALGMIERSAKQVHSNTIVAFEGLVISL